MSQYPKSAFARSAINSTALHLNAVDVIMEDPAQTIRREELINEVKDCQDYQEEDDEKAIVDPVHEYIEAGDIFVAAMTNINKESIRPVAPEFFEARYVSTSTEHKIQTELDNSIVRFNSTWCTIQKLITSITKLTNKLVEELATASHNKYEINHARDILKIKKDSINMMRNAMKGNK